MSVIAAARIGGGDSAFGECGVRLASGGVSSPQGCKGAAEGGDGERGLADGSFVVVGASEDDGGGGAVTASWMLGISGIS
jgi:hypothetical protein